MVLIIVILENVKFGINKHVIIKIDLKNFQ